MNKLIVVTGGTKGIGRAILEKFANEGFNVATCARNESDLERFKAEILRLQPNVKTYILKADMSVKAEVKKFTDFIQSLHRPVDILVNNAGYFAPGEIST